MTNKHRLVTLNGPLGSGKSWVADRLGEAYSRMTHDIIRVSFQVPLRIAAIALLGLPANINYDEFKKTLYLGKTGRQWMIDLSESFCKPYDPNFFSKVLVDNIRSVPRLSGRTYLFVADSNGFEAELDYLRTVVDLDILAGSIEPESVIHLRGQPYQEGDSRYNLAHKCAVVAPDSTQMLSKLVIALERRNWV